ncbi:MAG: hypothetical protein DELT_00192 [Desulfovibrio sp.]
MNKKLMNTDLWGAGIMFFFAAGFYSQMDPDFTHYAAFFPNHLIPILAILGVALLIKGFVKPTYLPAFYADFNPTFVFTMIVGLIWALLLDWTGFAITSFVAIVVLLVRFNLPALKNPKQFAKILAIAALEVAVIYVVFTQLQVSLPEGRLFY